MIFFIKIKHFFFINIDLMYTKMNIFKEFLSYLILGERGTERGHLNILCFLLVTLI